MFNSKKIKDLEKRIGQLEWQLENPPKYKVGDKTKTGIICEVIFLNKPLVKTNNRLSVFS